MAPENGSSRLRRCSVNGSVEMHQRDAHIATYEKRALVPPGDSSASTAPGPNPFSDVLLDDRPIILFGVNLSKKFSQQGVCIILFGSALSFALIFSAMQESVFHIPGFKYTGWMTTLMMIVYVICAGIEMKVCGLSRRGSYRDYLILSLLAPTGIYLTNWSLQYLSYSLRVMFKSAKVLPVMFVSRCYVGRRYGWKQYLSVLMLSLGIMFFSAGEGRNSNSETGVDPRGILLIIAALLADSMASNFEEKRLLCKEVGASPAEVVFFSSVPAIFWSVALDVFNGSQGPAIQHSIEHPEVVFYCVGFSVFGYIALTLVMMVIKHFGCVVAECLKSARKVCTIGLSFYLYGKSAGICHLVGLVLFVVSVALEFSHRRGKISQQRGVFWAKKRVVRQGPPAIV